MPSYIVETVDGTGRILTSRREFDSTFFQVVGDGFEGWYGEREIVAGLDAYFGEDTSTLLPGEADTDEFQTQAADEMEHGGGVELPWNPAPGQVFDNQLTLQPDGRYPNLKPTNSISGADFDDDPNFVVENFPRHSKKLTARQNQAFGRYLSALKSDSMIREAAWADVRQKAARIWRDGGVHVSKNDGREIYAKVEGDSGQYYTEVHRKNASTKRVTFWACSCPWGAYADNSQYPWRMCSHGLASYFAMQAGAQPSKSDRGITVVSPTLERHKLGTIQEESLAVRQGGLMVWDDDLAKTIKNIFNNPNVSQNGPGTGTPALDQSLAADPSGDDPDAVPGLDDPSVDPNASMDGSSTDDPTLIDPNVQDGLGQDTGFDPYAENEGSNSFPMQPRGVVSANSYPVRRNADSHHDAPTFSVNRPDGSHTKFKMVGDDEWINPDDPKTPLSSHDLEVQFGYKHGMRSVYTEFSEESNPSVDRDFEPWPDANSDDANTFNDVQDLNHEPESEEEYWDNGWNRSSSLGEDGEYNDPSLDYLREGPQVVESSYVEDVFGNPDETLPPPGQEPRGLSETTEDTINGSPEYNQYIRSLNRPEPGYSSPRMSRVVVEAEEETPWREIPRNKVAAYFGEGPNVFDEEEDSNYREAANFNENSDEIVKEFQKSAAAGLLKTAGRYFTPQEQDDLINEPGVARHLGDLDLSNSFYEEEI